MNMAFKASPRYRPEAEAAPTPKSDMEKNIDGLRIIRKGRLDRKEADYRRAVNQYNTAKKAVTDAEKEIEETRQNTTNEKNKMLKENLNLQMTQSSLYQWMERENHLDDMITKSIQHKESKEKDRLSFKKVMDAKKQDYDKALRGIEKLDILKEEIRLENADS